MGEISTASLGAVRDGSQQTVAGQDGDALRPVVATDHAGTLLQMKVARIPEAASAPPARRALTVPSRTGR